MTDESEGKTTMGADETEKKEPEGTTQETKGTAKQPRHRRMAVIGGIAALAVVCGLGVAFASGALSPTAQVATDDGSSSATVAQASDEDEALSPTDVAALAGTLSFDGKDVSVGEADVRVEVVGGRVMVTQTSSDDAATMVDATARRSAALATALADQKVATADAGSGTSSSGGSSTGDAVTADSGASASDAGTSASTAPAGATVTDVTWVTTDPTGTVVVAVSNAPETAPTTGTTAEVVNGSAGHDMTDAAYAAIGGTGSGMDQKGGSAVTDPTTGQAIVPGATTTTPAQEPTEQTTDAGSSAGTTGTTTSSSGATGSGATSGGSTTSSGTTSSGSSTASSGHWVTVTDSAAYDEPTYGQQWVQDSAAYDDQVYQYTQYTFKDSSGSVTYICTNSDDAFDYQMSTGLSYKDQDIYKTVHHDATGHYETVQTGTVHHDAVTHQEWVAN